jgi:hypothetical protein
MGEMASEAFGKEDLMERSVRWSCLLRRLEWLALSVAVLLIASGALMLYARQDAMHADVTGMLLAMYLASWSYALGVGGLVFLSAWVLVRARKNCLDAQEWHKWRN